jgi:MptA/FolE2 family GTP cyclohydrolase
LTDQIPLRILAAVQAEPDARGVEIDEVGIDQVSYPIDVLRPDGSTQPTVADVELVAGLRADRRGAHMSRFVEVLEVFHADIDAASVVEMARALRSRAESHRAKVVFRFPLFIAREAPITGETALMRFDCRYEGRSSTARDSFVLGVTAPITSLCPCSKEISDYGAHSQRGRVEVEAETVEAQSLTPDELLAVLEAAASAPIYPLLKRADERHVTMQAYDNPAFVEDVARDVALALSHDPRVERFSVMVANEESIHNHRAVARIRGGGVL